MPLHSRHSRHSRLNSISIGPTPIAEDCEQLGPHYDPIKAIDECTAFLHQLQRTFPAGHFWILENRHDFGTYIEVAAVIHEDCPTAEDDQLCPLCEAGYRAESDTPLYWDGAALEELRTAALLRQE